MFYFGVEHEVAFINNRGEFADFSCTKFDDFNQIIQKLPIYMDDYSQLRIGDAGIKQKRWYIEGFERFADSEKVIDCIPKGIEIRTTIHSTIQGVIAELSNSFELLRHVAAEVMHHGVETIAHQAAGQLAAHIPKADKANFHGRSSSSTTCLIVNHSIQPGLRPASSRIRPGPRRRRRLRLSLPVQGCRGLPKTITSRRGQAAFCI